jgi:hypothetical protein
MTELLIGFLCCLGGGLGAIALLVVAGLVKRAKDDQWKP